MPLVKTYSLLAPPVILISAFCSDQYESRGITMALTSLLAVVGFAVFLGNVVLRLNQLFVLMLDV